MKRNIEETAKKAIINEHYDLRNGDLVVLRETVKNGWWDAVVMAFKYGYVLGGRAKAKGLKTE